MSEGFGLLQVTTASVIATPMRPPVPFATLLPLPTTDFDHDDSVLYHNRREELFGTPFLTHLHNTSPFTSPIVFEFIFFLTSIRDHDT
jgi:hypothetical protein